MANHSACGAGSIPGTVRELDKFFAHADFPVNAQKNFYWTNGRVRQSEWTKDGDNKTSAETSTGFDGADASLLTYIASHGVTTNGLYRALAGSKKDGGCFLPSTSLELGNNASRYTILSTSQGLKIGSGDNPSSSGENPSLTWKKAAKGLNCILGYSNNMTDDDSYGTYLLERLKAKSTPLAEAFLSASEAVSKDNIPAVLCFGATEDDAAAFIRDNKTFDPDPRSNAASAFVYRKNFEVEGHLRNARETFASRVNFGKAAFNVQRLAKAFIGSTTMRTSKGASGITSYSSDAGTATYDARTNLLNIQNNIASADKLGEVPALDEATEIANMAIHSSNLSETIGELILTSNSEDVLGGSSGTQKVIARKLHFKQQIGGFQTLGQAGSVDVTVGVGGVITEVRMSLFKIKSQSKSIVNASTVSASTEDYESLAIQNVAEKVPGGSFKVVRLNYGYDAGNFFELHGSAAAVVEVTVEASLGGFTRRHIEKITL
ncbi:MAG: DUF6345 domain-containing protein [Proteobacteria bacterium]|nr:DUF6345 domain-containing protein [Pseudomonadota bacterium]